MSPWYGVVETGHPRIGLLGLTCVLSLAYVVGACTQDALTPRLPAYLKINGDSAVAGTELKSQSPINVGLSILSDASVPGSAPAIPDSMLSILGNRLGQFLRKNLAVSSVVSLTGAQLLANNQRSIRLFEEARDKGLPYLIVVVFSSVENETATHLGAQPIMAQMPGVTVENFALAELALVQTETRSIIVQSEGRSTASMDELTVPLGESNQPGLNGRDILRANAAQNALDRALVNFHKQWNQRSPMK